MPTTKKSIVIGSGFAGLSAAAFLAQQGQEVTVLEKNQHIGGRARTFSAHGYQFDMGPSWYWMPDVFERFFQQFGHSVSDYYELKRLDPSYAVFFGKNDVMNIPASMDELCQLFEQYEKGSGQRLRNFLAEAEYKYQVGINDLVYKPSRSLTEFMDFRLLTGMVKLHVFRSFSAHVRKFFKHPKLIQLMEFPVLFLGAMPQETPALYSLMNYADMQLGTWYPMGGMHKIVEAMASLAKSQGVHIETNACVNQIAVSNGAVQGVHVNGQLRQADVVVGGADYHHIESQLLDARYRNYSDSYWDSRVMAPSSLIFYLGVNKKIDGLLHHNLFFDEEFQQHAVEIYKDPKWPAKPLFYVCANSKTDPSAAPDGCENVFILVPVAPNLKDNEETRERYYNLVMDRLEKLTGQSIRPHVEYKRSYAHKDFLSDYNAFKGNAYGLANTLRQTAILKPALRNKKVNNLWYTGQLTVPGPGVPPSIISGQVVAGEIAKSF